MCEGENNLSAFNRRMSINPGGSLAFLALCLPFLVWKLSRPQSLLSLITAKGHSSLAVLAGFGTEGSTGNAPTSLSGGMLLHWLQCLNVPCENEKMPTFVKCQCFRGVGGDIKGCGEIEKIMLLAFPFRIGIAEFHRGSESYCCLGMKTWAGNKGLAIATVQLGKLITNSLCHGGVEKLFSTSTTFQELLSSFPPLGTLLQSAARRPCASCFVFVPLLALSSSISCFQTIFFANLIHTRHLILEKKWSQVLFWFAL